MYDYNVEKQKLFTDEGRRLFLKIRDHVHKVLETSGAITMVKAMAGTGDSWQQMACVDRMVELEEIKEVKYGDVAGQYRIFIPRIG